MTTAIPDGEYELELSDALWTQLTGAGSPALPPGSAKRKNDEIVSITYDIVPTDIDDSKTLELARDETQPEKFQIKAESTDDSDAVMIDGDLAHPSQLECVLVYNDKMKSFELQRVDTRLRTTGSTKIVSTKEPIKRIEPVVKPKVDPAPKKRRTKAETSIFQPKRAKTPLPTVPKNRRSPSVNSSDDELPLSKLASPKKPTAPASKPSAPSPLNPSYSRDLTIVDSAQSSPEKKKPLQQPIAIKVSTPSIPEPSSAISSPVVTQELKLIHRQVSSKKPPSAVSTPTIPQQSSPEEESDEDDEFGALVDELEGELLGDDFFTVEEGEPEIKQPKSYDFTTSESHPTNFRSLAGQSRDEDEDVSSSEEE